MIVEESEQIYSKAYVLYDVTSNKLLHDLNPNERREIASLTKIMSSIVAIEKTDNLDQKVTITQEMLDTVPNDAYIIHLKPGEEVTIRDLLYGTLLPSGADAVNSLAIATYGSIDKFVEAMNNKAKELGLNDTLFHDPIGMDGKDSYSTANDVYHLMKYALENKLFKEIFETKYYKLTNGIDAYNSAMMFGKQINIDTSRILGDKTGYTTPAEFCIAFEFISHEHTFYGVFLGAPVEEFKDFKHIKDAVNTINYVDNNMKYYKLVENSSVYKTINVVNSKVDSYNIYNDKDIELLLEEYDPSQLRIEDTLPTEISYLNKKGETIGNIKYFYDNELLYERTVELSMDIEPNTKEYIKIHKYEFIGLGVIIVLLLLIIIIWIKKGRKKNEEI